jgi:hypothetical protein
MTAKTRILIPLGGAGEIRTESRGFPDQTCRVFTGPIITALGGQVTSDEKTNEVVDEQVVLEGTNGG